jgi:FeS assembly SUF system regulator
MIRMTKQTDYGFVLLSQLAAAPARVANAPDLAAATRLPPPTVSKILKLLARHGLLVSHRGVKGGYSLARPPAAVTVAEILRAIEGPVALTVCIEGSPGECEREDFCQVRRHWQLINVAVDSALAQVTLADLTHPATARLVQLGGARDPGPGTERATEWMPT